MEILYFIVVAALVIYILYLWASTVLMFMDIAKKDIEKLVENERNMDKVFLNVIYVSVILIILYSICN